MCDYKPELDQNCTIAACIGMILVQFWLIKPWLQGL